MDRPTKTLLALIGGGYVALCATLIFMAWSPRFPLGIMKAADDLVIARRAEARISN
jgi:hypothetical protein